MGQVQDSIEQARQELIRSRMRPMPAGFNPCFIEQGEEVVCDKHDGFIVRLGFVKTGNPLVDAALVDALKVSVWQHIEACRLRACISTEMGHA